MFLSMVTSATYGKAQLYGREHGWKEAAEHMGNNKKRKGCGEEGEI